VWVRDGVGERRYTYDAWGRVTRQQGCCGSENGIEVQAVTAEYDGAGRKRFEKERRADESVVRTIAYSYDPLGRLQSVGDGQRQITYHYDTAGRLWQVEELNQQVITYTYYGDDSPTQVGWLKRVEYRTTDGTLQQGYEYHYDVLGQVQMVEDLATPAKTHLQYDGVGRCTVEERLGTPSYLVQRVYRLDGQLEQEYVETSWENRTDVVWRLYTYDEATGQLQGVYDLFGGTKWWFEWEQDRLVRWHADDRSYVREFEYDEEGRIVAIWLQAVSGAWRAQGYAYQFSVEGDRVWWRSGLNRLEFRRWCGGLTEWYREDGSGSWGVWRQRLGGEECGSCGHYGSEGAWNERAWVDAALLPDGDYQPQALPAAIVAACVIACSCSLICAVGAVLPCVEQCKGSPNPVGCVKKCVRDIIKELPDLAQLLCGACLLGCAICLIVALLRFLGGGGGTPHPPGRPHPRPPERPTPPPSPPQPPSHPPSEPPRLPKPGRPRPGDGRRMDPMECWWLCHNHCIGLFPHEPPQREDGRYVIPDVPPEYHTCKNNCMAECLNSPPGWKPKPGYPYQ
jgi:YD repeat-containing protein